jgi:hypothetical protein
MVRVNEMIDLDLLHLFSKIHNRLFFYCFWPQRGFEPGSSPLQEDAMTTTPSGQGRNIFIVILTIPKHQFNLLNPDRWIMQLIMR